MSEMADIRPGMRVIDSLGQHVGWIDQVVEGDGGPVTTSGQGGLPSGLARALGSAPNVHPQTGARMLRGGYVTIRCKGRLLSKRRYAAADQIRGVDKDVVQLTVCRDEALYG